MLRPVWPWRQRSDVVVVIDVRRYDRWVVDAAARRPRRRVCGWSPISDSLLSPIAAMADRTLVVAAAGAGPFDSHVGTLALCQPARRRRVPTVLRGDAVQRLDRAEQAWNRASALSER